MEIEGDSGNSGITRLKHLKLVQLTGGGQLTAVLSIVFVVIGTRCVHG